MTRYRTKSQRFTMPSSVLQSHQPPKFGAQPGDDEPSRFADQVQRHTSCIGCPRSECNWQHGSCWQQWGPPEWTGERIPYRLPPHIGTAREQHLRGLFRIMSLSGGLKPRAVAGSPSVTRFTQSSWTGFSTSGSPAKYPQSEKRTNSLAQGFAACPCSLQDCF